MNNGFARIAAISPRVWLGDVQRNEEEILSAMESLAKQGTELAVFPELCLTGYTLGDLLRHGLVCERAWEAALRLAKKTGSMAVVIGLPFDMEGKVFNCAAVLQEGKVRGIVPKAGLSQGSRGEEGRWFVSGKDARGIVMAEGEEVPFSDSLLFAMDGFQFSVKIGGDAEANCAFRGDIIVNPMAQCALVGQYENQRQLLMQLSSLCCAGIVRANAGFGESTSDLVFSGDTGVYELGNALAEGKRFQMDGGQAIADVDISRLRFHRQQKGEQPAPPVQALRLESSAQSLPLPLPLLRRVKPLPFIPEGPLAAERLAEIVNIQAAGLKTRLRAIGCKVLVIGVSGGLDSTLALLIAARAFDELGYSREGIHGITMPGMGTGVRTKTNADALMEALHISAKEISIQAAVLQHFADIGQDENVHDTTYENAQARERTQILMDYANMTGGIVLGTGDLSEAALGFCTFNGDHMSMYNVNCSVPKTLVRGLVRYLGETVFGGEIGRVCADILDTPISPELLPVTEGELAQRTEDILGDYALHDFFLYHFMDSASSPERLRLLAAQAFDGVYEQEQIEKQLATFLRRFFTQQFKRNCVPDGPRIGSVGLSPRGGWRMPSDMAYTLWK